MQMASAKMGLKIDNHRPSGCVLNVRAPGECNTGDEMFGIGRARTQTPPLGGTGHTFDIFSGQLPSIAFASESFRDLS